MKLSHNPQSVANGYISMSRNMFLLSSIGVASMAFSDKFNKYKKIVQILALSIFAFSITYGYKASTDFNLYINTILKQEDISEPHNSLLQQWKGWITLSYVYIFIMLVMSSIIFLRKIV